MCACEMPEYNASGQRPGFTVSRIESVSGARTRPTILLAGIVNLATMAISRRLNSAPNLDPGSAAPVAKCRCVAERNSATRSRRAFHRELAPCSTTTTVTITMTTRDEGLFFCRARASFSNYHRSNSVPRRRIREKT